jgi:hypothetical protein
VTGVENALRPRFAGSVDGRGMAGDGGLPRLVRRDDEDLRRSFERVGERAGIGEVAAPYPDPLSDSPAARPGSRTLTPISAAGTRSSSRSAIAEPSRPVPPVMTIMVHLLGWYR